MDWLPPYRDCKYINCTREKELVAPVRPQCLQAGVWSWPFPIAWAKGERILGMCQYPATPTLENYKALVKDWASANCDHDSKCLLCATEHKPDNNFHPGKGHGLQRARFLDNIVWSVKRPSWRELLMFTTLNQTLIEFIPALYLFWNIIYKWVYV